MSTDKKKEQSSNTITATQIELWLKDHRAYSDWLQAKASAPQPQLQALELTLSNMIVNWDDWLQFFELTKLTHFIIYLLKLCDQRLNIILATNQNFSAEIVSDCIAGILADANTAITLASAGKKSPVVTGCLTSNPIATLLECSGELLQSQTEPTTVLSVINIEYLLILLRRLLEMRVLSFQSLTSTLAPLKKLSDLGLIGQKSNRWLEVTLLENIKTVTSKQAATYLNVFAILTPANWDEQDLKTQTIILLLERLTSQRHSLDVETLPDVETLLAGLQDFNILMSKAFFSNPALTMHDWTKAAQDLTAHLVKDQDLKKESSTNLRANLVATFQLVYDTHQWANEFSTIPQAIDSSILKNMATALLQNVTRVPPPQLISMLTQLGVMIQLGKTPPSDVAQITPDLIQITEMLDQRAVRFNLPQTAQALYALSLTGPSNTELTKNLVDRFEDHLTQGLLTKKEQLSDWQIQASKGAHYLERYGLMGATMPKYLAPYIKACQPKVKEGSIQDQLRTLLPKQPWFAGFTYQPEEILGFHPVDICLTDIITKEKHIRQLDGPPHLAGTDHNKKMLPRWKDKLADESLRKIIDEKTGKPLLASLKRYRLIPPNSSDINSILAWLENSMKTSTLVEEKKKLAASTAITKKVTPIPDTTPTVYEPTWSIDIAEVERKPKSSSSDNYEKSLSGLSKAIKDEDDEAVQSLLSTLKLDEQQKAEMLMVTLAHFNPQQYTPRIKKILNSLYEQASAATLTLVNKKGISPIVQAAKSANEHAIKLFITKSSTQFTRMPEQWRKALQISKDIGNSASVTALEQAGVTTTIPDSSPLGLTNKTAGSLDTKQESGTKDIELNGIARVQTTLRGGKTPRAADIPLLKKMAENHHAIAQYYLSSHYMLSEKTRKLGYFWLESSANLGYPPAQCTFAQTHKPKSELHHKWLKLAAENGVTLAQNELGLDYLAEKDKKLHPQGFTWLEKAAKKGFKLAQLNLANCYFNGNGTPKDPSKAMRWLQLAAQNDLAPAQYLLGCHYFFGKDVPENKVMGIKWYRLAAQSGYAQSQLELAKAYQQGIVVSKNPQKFLKWCRLAAKQQFAAAQITLGNYYLPKEGTEPNEQESIKWFKKAADNKEPYGLYMLFVIYKDHNTQTDNKMAFDYCKAAAEKGLAQAQFKLSEIYEQGVIIPRDRTTGIHWLKSAAELQHPNAQYTYGLYFLGENNLIDAARQLSAAANQKFPHAIDQLKQLMPTILARANRSPPQITMELCKIARTFGDEKQKKSAYEKMESLLISKDSPLRQLPTNQTTTASPTPRHVPQQAPK